MIRTEIIDFGNNVPSMVYPDENGDFVIFLNSRLCYERQRCAFVHELRHIYDDDFEKCGDVSMMEYLTHESDIKGM